MNTIFDRCRLCLDPSVEISTTIDSPQLKDQIEKVFCFSIEPKQGYCSGVCQSCSYTISEFYQYSEKVRQNQEILNGNATNCDQTKESKVSLECVKQEPLNDFGLPETIEDAHKPDNEVSEAEEAPILDSKISQGNDMLQTMSDSEMMETNHDACGLINEVPEAEEKVHALHSEITLEDFKIEIHDFDFPSDLPETIDEEKEVPILDSNATFESEKAKTPTESEPSETAEQINKKIQSQKEDQFFKKHIKMVCDLCGKVADSYPALHSHFRKVHKRRRSYVVCCNKKLYHRCHIREHINFHANPDMFRCEVCGRTFKKQDTLNVHMLKKHPQTHKCNHCPRSFVAESALIDHMKLHKKCPKCNKLCTNKSFRNHMIKKHGDKEPDSNVSEAEESLSLDSKMSQENDYVQTPSGSEMMESNQDALELKDVVPELEEEVHTLRSEITLEDPNIEITVSGLPGTTDEEQDIPILDSEIMVEKGHIEMPKESEHSKTTDQTQTREEEDQFFKNHISLVCDLCGILAESYTALDSHFKKVHKRRNSYVVCCNKKLFYRNQVREHINLHANPDLFRCKVCGFRFKRREFLNVHMLKRHPQILKCAHCPQTFAEESALTEHMKLHIDNTKVQCSKCNKFCSKEFRHIHMFRKHGEKLPKKSCDICGEEYRIGSLNRHMKKHMGIETYKFKCKVCKLRFTKEQSFNNHMITQHATDEVQCDQCPKKFKHFRALDSHKIWWHTEPKHECEHCGQKFKFLYKLKEHRAIHTGEVLFTCKLCGKSFNSRSNMVTHMRRLHPEEWEQKKLMNTKSIDPSEAGQPLKQ